MIYSSPATILLKASMQLSTLRFLPNFLSQRGTGPPTEVAGEEALNGALTRAEDGWSWGHMIKSFSSVTLGRIVVSSAGILALIKAFQSLLLVGSNNSLEGSPCAIMR